MPPVLPLRQDVVAGGRPHAAITGHEVHATTFAAVALGGTDALAMALSHDLRAPLRAIEGYAHALLEDYGTALPDDAQHLLARIRAATATLEQRIDGLLEVSRAASAGVGQAPCDLSAIAADLVDLLRRGEPRREVVVTIESGIRAVGDAPLVGIVLENLLANAWKFTRGRTPARIDVTATTSDGRIVVSVRDNGVGFDMRDVHRLGVPFQRLHAGPVFEGNGIGLASARRIVERHGGRLWAESAPGQGATFYVSLPAVSAF